MQTRRPSLQSRRSPNGETLFLNIAGQTDRAQAFVYCQWKQRACRRDSFSHGVHTTLFAAKKMVKSALCLRPPAGDMRFPPTAQGRDVRSPFREFPPAID